MRWSVVLALALCGCFDFDAAGRCFGADSDCATAVTSDCDGQASRCAGLPVALCDGFEEPSLAPSWYAYPGPAGASVSVDTSRACRGTSSAHFHLDGAATSESPRMIIEETRTDEPTPLGDRWIRAFAFIPSTSVTASLNTVLIVGQPGAPYHQMELGTAGGKLAYATELASPPLTYSNTTLPTDRWVCIVFAIKQGSPGEVHISVDGNPISDLQLSTETNPSPPLAVVRIGTSFYQLSSSQGPVDLWLDEVAIDGAALDCSR